MSIERHDQAPAAAPARRGPGEAADATEADRAGLYQAAAVTISRLTRTIMGTGPAVVVALENGAITARELYELGCAALDLAVITQRLAAPPDPSWSIEPGLCAALSDRLPGGPRPDVAPGAPEFGTVFAAEMRRQYPPG